MQEPQAEPDVLTCVVRVKGASISTQIDLSCARSARVGEVDYVLEELRPHIERALAVNGGAD